MFKSIFSCIALVATFSLLQAAPTQTKNDDFVLLTLRAATSVSLTLNQPINAEDFQVGNSLDFFVRSNVTVNGKVVIAAGAIAEGWVKSVKSGCDGKCSEITIEVHTVQAVDGQMVNLRSIPHIIKAPCCNGRAEGNIGTNLTARVLNDIKIDA